MQFFLDIFLNGVLTGSIYGLTAIGLTLVFGVMKLINLAHGSFLMIAMYGVYGLAVGLGVDPYLSMLIVVPACFCMGYISQTLFINPILKTEKDVREPISVLLLTAGLWIFINNLFLTLFGANFRSIETPYSQSTFAIGDILISQVLVYAFVFSLAATFGLSLLLKKTRIGRAIRSVGQDREAASLMGVDIFKTYKIAFGLGLATLGVAAAVLVPMFYVHPFAGDTYDLRDFVIVVLGGLGSVPGALIGGIIIGVVESLASQYLTMSWAEGLIYIIFLLVLFIRPQGLFGFEKEA